MKNFTLEQFEEALERTGHRCEACGEYKFGELEAHHKKPKSILRKWETDKHGPGGGQKNLAVLCRECHEKTHQFNRAFWEFMTHGWQKIGETWADEEGQDGQVYNN